MLALVLWAGHHRRQASTLATGCLTTVRPVAGKITGSLARLPVKWGIAPLLVVAVLASLAAATMPDNNLHVSILDVGQGDAILIHQGSQQILVDGGPSPQAIALALGKKMPFWDRTIDLVVLTHPSADHVCGLVSVLNSYRVKQVLQPDLDFESNIYDEWLRLVESFKSAEARAGQQISFGTAVISVLNPPLPHLEGTQSDIDNNGVVLHISLGQVSFLLTADTMAEAELELITRRADLASTVLKVGHHGSSTSTTPEFLAVVNPQIASISVGADNEYGHPAPEVMARLGEKLGAGNIYRTDERGTIEFITDGERLWVRTER